MRSASRKENMIIEKQAEIQKAALRQPPSLNNFQALIEVRKQLDNIKNGTIIRLKESCSHFSQ